MNRKIIILLALQLVKIRAEAMQLAGETFKGGMLTVFYGPDSKLNSAVIKAKEWALDRGDPNPECVVANYLYPDCKVVSGSDSVSILVLIFIRG